MDGKKTESPIAAKPAGDAADAPESGTTRLQAPRQEGSSKNTQEENAPESGKGNRGPTSGNAYTGTAKSGP